MNHKNYFLSASLALLVALMSCTGNNTSSGNSSTPGNKDAATDNNASSSNSSPGNASWSCVIDGKAVSGGQISSYAGPEGYQSNEAHIVEVDQGKELLFYLSDPQAANTQGVHTLRFGVPNKTGISSFGTDEDGWFIDITILVNDKHEANYNSDSFTINVTSLSATSVSGTFSGKFSLNGNITDTDKKEIEVTDGKFDIPMKN